MKIIYSQDNNIKENYENTVMDGIATHKVCQYRLSIHFWMHLCLCSILLYFNEYSSFYYWISLLYWEDIVSLYTLYLY